MSGHLATVTVYEEAKGELRAHVYLPQFSAAIELAVSNRVLKSLYPHADEHWEQPHLASQDAMRLLNPIGDRLEVRPSLMEINDMGRVARPAPGKEPTTLAQLARHQGLGGAEGKGRPGRLLFRRMAKESGVNYVITCREYGRDGLLRVRLYETVSPWSGRCAVALPARRLLARTRQLARGAGLLKRPAAAAPGELRPTLAADLPHGQDVPAQACWWGASPAAPRHAVMVYLDEGDGSATGCASRCRRPTPRRSTALASPAPRWATCCASASAWTR